MALHRPTETTRITGHYNVTDQRLWASVSRPGLGREHLPLWAGVYASARVPQWSLKPEESHGANDLDPQARRCQKSRSGWHGLHLRAFVSRFDAVWKAHQGQGLEPRTKRQRERWNRIPGAVLRFLRKELQQWQREAGERAGTGVTKRSNHP